MFTSLPSKAAGMFPLSQQARENMGVDIGRLGDLVEEDESLIACLFSEHKIKC